MIVNEKHYLPNRDYLTQPIQMQLSWKQKTFREILIALLKSILNFKRLPKKDDRRSWWISGITGFEKYV